MKISDLVLTERIELALSAKLLHEDQSAADWRRCVSMFGPTHASAIGCLMFGLLPEAWDSDNVALSPDGVTWAVFVDGAKISEKAEKFAAMIAALEAAPS